METENKWNRKNVLWMLLYAVVYVVMSVIVCVLGSVHPIMFVCYQITAGLLAVSIVSLTKNTVTATAPQSLKSI